MTKITFLSPKFFRANGQLENEFEYHGVFLDMCFERLIRDLGIVSDPDEFLTITMSSVVLREGDVVTVDMFIEETSLEFAVIETSR